MSDAQDSALNDCECCDTNLPSTRHENRAGLSTINYRVGTHGAFMKRMLARIAGNPALIDLRTRERDDPAIALFDAWACTADVLTFYQERIANEGFLRTATERRSILELARAIGYELGPGVAASTFLAFTVDDTFGAPGVATVPQGTRVQSLPTQGQMPQVFETIEQITAYAAWNALKPCLTAPQIFDASTNMVYISSVNPDVKVGDTLLLVYPDSSGTTQATPQTVSKVVKDTKNQQTLVYLGDPTPTTISGAPPILNLDMLAYASPIADSLDLDQSTVNSYIRSEAWREQDLDAFLTIQNWDRRAVETYLNNPNATDSSTIQALYSFKTRVGVFGNNAPLHASLSDKQLAVYTNDWDAYQPDITTDSNFNDYRSGFEVDFFCERSLPEITKGGWVVLEDVWATFAYQVQNTIDYSLVDYALNSKVTGVRVAKADGSDAQIELSDYFYVRNTTVFAGSNALTLINLPVTDALGAGTWEESQIALNRYVLGLPVGGAISIAGELATLPGVMASEAAILKEIVHSNGFTTIAFEKPLQNQYRRSTVSINANVARATHGETVREVLGSGDGSKLNQVFQLKKPPLTYVSAATPGGGKSTLEVRVNGILWQEAESLYELGPLDQSYITRRENDGNTRVIFGDGHHGARLSSGQENVTAVYRSGIGMPGDVDAGTLTLLQSRPPSVKDVNNPLAANGAGDPEVLDNARENAPLRVRTLDRIVSLDDYEDFVRARSGIAKARAVAQWQGERQVVHITVAPADAKPLDTDSDLYRNLVKAIRQSCDPAQQVVIESYQKLTFNVDARVIVNDRYEDKVVLDAVNWTLIDSFSFTKRSLSQLVTEGEVLSVIQNVPGIIAADLNSLYLSTDSAGTLDSVLPPINIFVDSLTHELKPVPLLIINPAGIKVSKMETPS